MCPEFSFPLMNQSMQHHAAARLAFQIACYPHVLSPPNARSHAPYAPRRLTVSGDLNAPIVLGPFLLLQKIRRAIERVGQIIRPDLYPAQGTDLVDATGASVNHDWVASVTCVASADTLPPGVDSVHA